jgi:alanine dehydrogenase
MLIGVPKEIKNFEYRVGLIPSSVRELIHHGHQVIVQKDAGSKIGFTDEVYRQVGAGIVEYAKDIYQQADMIVKVKAPQPEECRLLQPNQILFAYLHLAADSEQAKLLLASGCTAIAYETVTNAHGELPLLAPMSEVAGRMSIQAGASCLEIEQGGRGILLAGVPGVMSAKVVILGGGMAGRNAALIAIGMGAQVVVIDKSLDRLYQLDLQFGSQLHTVFSTTHAIEEHVLEADLVIGAVLIPGGSAPKLVTKPMLSRMRPGSVVVDVSIDQGGCFESSRATTHQHPTYMLDGVVHYCVDNMPGAVPYTSTFALNNATLPFVLMLADQGYQAAMRHDAGLMNGLNVCQGKITHKTVAEALHLPYVPMG